MNVVSEYEKLAEGIPQNIQDYVRATNDFANQSNTRLIMEMREDITSTKRTIDSHDKLLNEIGENQKKLAKSQDDMAEMMAPFIQKVQEKKKIVDAVDVLETKAKNLGEKYGKPALFVFKKIGSAVIFVYACWSAYKGLTN